MSLPPSERDLPIPRLSPALRGAIADRVQARDLPGALAVVREASSAEPGRTEMTVALARLVAAMERLDRDAPTGKRTVPLDAHGFVLFQLRMGNLGEAERALRQIVLERANDHVAKERLRDVSLVRGAIEAASEAPAAPAGWLDKRNSRLTGEGWAPVSKGPSSGGGGWDEEVETSVLRPEQEAELLLRSGQPARALEVYRRVLGRDPQRADIAARVQEIEELLDERCAPIPGEVTVLRDVRALVDPRAAGAADSSGLEPGSAGEVPSIADDAPTIFGRRSAELVAPSLVAPSPPVATPPREAARASTPSAPTDPSAREGVAAHRIVPVG